MAPSRHAQRLLDVNEVADRMGVTVRFVRRLVDQRRLPYRKLGKFVRFDPAEVEDWIDACKVDPISRISQARTWPAQSGAVTANE